MNEAFVKLEKQKQIGYITFFHPASNSMPSGLLKQLKQNIEKADVDDEIKVIVLKSEGKTFCAGASFNELIQLNDKAAAIEFFMGFARVINAMRKTNKFIIVQVQGKAVGGGVGLIAAADYAMATDKAAIKLSELSIGIGPYVIAPAVKRKMGISAFSELSVNATKWHTAFWAREKGLYAQVLDNQNDLEEEIELLAEKLSTYDVTATKLLKREIWSGTESWDNLLSQKATITAELILRDFAKNILAEFKR
jgi:methylglutaconyl-CoA hydratase